MDSCGDLWLAAGQQWTQQTKVKLPDTPRALRMINERLWCCCFGTEIVVYDTELQKQCVVPAGDMDLTHDAALLSNGDVALGAYDGLFIADDTGTTQCQFSLTRQIWCRP